MRGAVFVEGAPGPAPATLSVDSSAVVARADDGTTHRVPLAEAKVSAGGFDGDHVFVRAADDGLTISTADAAIVDALAAVADDRMQAMLQGIGAHKRTHARWKIAGIVTVGVGGALVVAAIAVGVFVAPRLLAGSVDALPVEVDRQLGDAASAEVDTAGPPVEDPAVVGFVEQVVARLEPHAATEGFDYRVRVVQSDTVNAYALPGGRIVVFTGLIERADSPAQVAGVLAHEIAHVTLRHGIRNVAHQAGLVVAVSILLGDAGGWAELAAEAAVLAQSNDYSREQETAADAEGVRMMMAAGLDPAGLADFFRHLRDEPGGEVTGAMSWLSTHPDHASRIAHVQELAETLPAAPPRPLDVDWPAVQAAASSAP